MDAAKLLRDTRLSSGLKQEELAYRAGTTQTYVSRVERGLANPSLSTLERLFAVMGQELRLTAVPGDLGNASRADLRRDFLELTPEERIDQAFTLSEFLTDVAANAGRPGSRHGAKRPRIDGRGRRETGPKSSREARKARHGTR